MIYCKYEVVDEIIKLMKFLELEVSPTTLEDILVFIQNKTNFTI